MTRGERFIKHCLEGIAGMQFFFYRIQRYSHPAQVFCYLKDLMASRISACEILPPINELWTSGAAGNLRLSRKGMR